MAHIKLKFYIASDHVVDAITDPLKEFGLTSFISCFRLPDFMKSNIILTYWIKNGEALFLEKSLDKNENIKIEKNVQEIAFIWSAEIEIREYHGVLSSRALISGKIVQQFTYYSDEDFDSFLEGMLVSSPESVLVDENNQFFTKDSLLQRKQLYTLFKMPLHDSYASLTLKQLETFVDFSFGGKESLLKKRSATGDQRESILTTFKRHCNNSLNERTESFRSSFIPSDRQKEWEKVLDHIYTSLTYLDSAYYPTTNLNEAARRLIINNVVIPVCAFFKIPFNVEYSMFTVVKRGKIGWGSLDYRFVEATHEEYALIIKAAVENYDEVLDELEREINNKTSAEYEELLKSTAESLNEEPSTPVRVSHVPSVLNDFPTLQEIDAKAVYEDNHLAQLIAQLYDMFKFTNGEKPVRGILNTGTHWWYFALHPAQPSASSSSMVSATGKPLLVYEGERSLNIIGDPGYGIERRSSATRASSSSIGSISNVSRAQVVAVVASFAATLLTLNVDETGK